MDRRRYLAVLASGAAFTAGCLGAVRSSPDGVSGIPSSADDCDVGSLPEANYPELPSTVDGSTAKTFALEFEIAYTTGELAAEEGTTVDGTDGTKAQVEESTSEGVVLSLRVGLDYRQDVDNDTLYGSRTSYAWYYVTDAFAMRAATDGRESRPTEGWETVACA